MTKKPLRALFQSPRNLNIIVPDNSRERILSLTGFFAAFIFGMVVFLPPFLFGQELLELNILPLYRAFFVLAGTVPYWAFLYWKIKPLGYFCYNCGALILVDNKTRKQEDPLK